MLINGTYMPMGLEWLLGTTVGQVSLLVSVVLASAGALFMGHDEVDEDYHYSFGPYYYCHRHKSDIKEEEVKTHEKLGCDVECFSGEYIDDEGHSRPEEKEDTP